MPILFKFPRITSKCQKREFLENWSKYLVYHLISLLLKPLLIQISFHLIGEDYASAPSSKYCSLYGCSNTASTLIYCIRISSKVFFFRENTKHLCISFHGKGRPILLGGEQYKEKHKISGHPRLWAEQPEVPGLLLQPNTGPRP